MFTIEKHCRIIFEKAFKSIDLFLKINIYVLKDKDLGIRQQNLLFF
jgi:hypothetical protein